MQIIDFYVPGLPQPQGSTKSYAKGDRVVTTSANPKLKSWRVDIITCARKCRNGSELEGPAEVYLDFWLPRPAGHYGSKGVRPSAPSLPAKRPDLDKLQRSVLDALTEARIWRDDGQVVRIVATKRYGDPGCRVVVKSCG